MQRKYNIGWIYCKALPANWDGNLSHFIVLRRAQTTSIAQPMLRQLKSRPRQWKIGQLSSTPQQLAPNNWHLGNMPSSGWRVLLAYESYPALPRPRRECLALLWEISVFTCVVTTGQWWTCFHLTEIYRHSIQITFEQDSLTFIHSGSPWSKRSDLKIYFCTSHFLSVSDLSILVVDAHLQTKLFDRPPFDGETLALSFQDTARFPTTQSFFSKIQWYVFSKILPGCFWLKHLIVQYEDLVDMASFSKVRFAWTAWVGWHWP